MYWRARMHRWCLRVSEGQRQIKIDSSVWRDKDRHREERLTEEETETVTKTETERQKDKDRQRQRQTDREAERQRQTAREIHSPTHVSPTHPLAELAVLCHRTAVGVY